MLDTMMLFTGNANRPLARAVARHLQVPLGKATVGRFSDGEITVEITENVRGRDAIVIQPTCAPANDNSWSYWSWWMLCGAHRRLLSWPWIPYLGYARQDRRPRSARVPITAKVIANMITSVGADRVLTVDLHAEQIQGFFDIPDGQHIRLTGCCWARLQALPIPTSWWCRPTSAAWCARALSRGEWRMLTSPSSISGGRAPTNRRS